MMGSHINSSWVQSRFSYRCDSNLKQTMKFVPIQPNPVSAFNLLFQLSVSILSFSFHSIVADNTIPFQFLWNSQLFKFKQSISICCQFHHKSNQECQIQGQFLSTLITEAALPSRFKQFRSIG